MRSPIGGLFSTNHPAQKLFLSLPRKRQGGDSPCLNELAVASLSNSYSRPIWQWLLKSRYRRLAMFVSGALSVLSTAAPRSIPIRSRRRFRARQSLASRPHSMARLRLRTDVLSKQTSIATKCFAWMRRRQSRSTSSRVPSHLEGWVRPGLQRSYPPSPTRSLRQPASDCESYRSTLPH